MKKVSISALILFLAMAFVSGSVFAAEQAANETANVQTEDVIEVADRSDEALEAELAKIFETNEWLHADTADVSAEFNPSTSWVCNQGAYCTYRRDPACGPEGFCNLPTNCCMCY